MNNTVRNNENNAWFYFSGPASLRVDDLRMRIYWTTRGVSVAVQEPTYIVSHNNKTIGYTRIQTGQS